MLSANEKRTIGQDTMVNIVNSDFEKFLNESLMNALYICPVERSKWPSLFDNSAVAV